MSEAATLLPALVILLGVIVLGLPVYAGILGAALYLDVFVNQLPLAAVFTGLYESLAKPSLMAVPLFILTGAFMEASSMGERLIYLFWQPLRRIRGGMPFACVLSNAFFGAISGSAPAAAATFSKIAYRPLEQEYGESLAMGLISSSGCLSTIIPPSIIMIIYGVVTDTSITNLFLAGFGPGLLLVTIVGAYLVTRPMVGSPAGAGADTAQRRRSVASALPVLVIPVLVLGGIYAGFFTPTEAGAVSAVYCALAAMYLYRDIRPGDVLRIFGEGAWITGQVFILIAASAVLAQAATLAQVPQTLTESLSGFSTVGFLLFVNVLLLIVGCFFDPAAAILILAPLLLPTARQLGIDPLHLGIVFTVNLSIGMFTPPFGLNLFVVQSVLKKPLERLSGAVVPYVFLYVSGLLLITYIPRISLWLPTWLAR